MTERIRITAYCYLMHNTDFLSRVDIARNSGSALRSMLH